MHKLPILTCLLLEEAIFTFIKGRFNLNSIINQELVSLLAPAVAELIVLLYIFISGFHKAHLKLAANPTMIW